MSLATWLLILLGFVTAFVMAFVWMMIWSMWKMEAESRG